MKAIYLNEVGTERVQTVYSPSTQKELASLLDLDEKVYSKANLDQQAAANAEVVLSTWGMPEYSEEEIKKTFPNLKIIFYGAGTVQAFAQPFLNCGIRVVSAWAANAVPVAEFTLSQIILANKGYFLSQKIMKEEGWQATGKFVSQNYRGSFDSKLGIIGAGMIGRKVIEMLNACGIRLNIMVFDPFLPADKAKELGVTLCSLEELFEECQVISNHLANNPQTVGMLNYNLFKRMKPSATFINTGRGAQIVEDDLVRALKEAPNRTALLDVTYPEPPEEGHDFYIMPNVFMTAHIAGSIGDETYRMSEFMLEELRLYLDGKTLKYEVRAEMLHTMA